MLAELITGVAFMVTPAAPPPIQVTPPPPGAAYGTIAIPAIGIRAPIRQLPARGTASECWIKA